MKTYTYSVWFVREVLYFFKRVYNTLFLCYNKIYSNIFIMLDSGKTLCTQTGSNDEWYTPDYGVDAYLKYIPREI